SGTNQFHGTGFGYFRNDKFGDAPNFFTNQVLPFDQKQMGVNGGGPFRKDKSFFFGSYEQQKLLATARPNTGFAIFDVNVPQDTPRYYTTGRIDQQISDKHRLFVRVSEYNWNQPNQGVSGSTTVSGGYSQESINTDLSIGETWVISSRAVHEIRA